MKWRLAIVAVAATAGAMAGGSSWAQAPDGKPGRTPGAGPAGDGRELRRELREMKPEVIDPDTNDDCLVDDQEALAGATKALQRVKEMLERMRQQFDADGDGALNEAEASRLRNWQTEKGRPMPHFLSEIDANQDMAVSAAEEKAAIDRMVGLFKRRNEGILNRFDANGDGKLDEAETAKAREGIKEMREKPRQLRRQRNRGAEGEPPAAEPEPAEPKTEGKPKG